jgi:tetratricopeptide (TPR) repeat protein
MRQSEPMNPALGAAAFGLALIDAGAVEARTRPIENVRLAQSPGAVTTGDAYQDGRALLAAGDTAGAIAAFRAALVASPQSIDALNGLGVAYDRIGRYDLSRSWYDTALAIDPTAVLVLNNLGYSLYLQGQYAAAIPLLQQVVDSDDAAARQTGQRLLTLIAARMRSDMIDGRPPVSYAQTAPRRGPTMVAASSPTEMPVASRPTATPAASRLTATPARQPAAIAAPAIAAPAIATAVPVTAVEPPQARIEITSSGEQRLVIGGPALAPELVAALGDAAPMVMVADSWTPRAEARLAARAVAQEQALAERARLAGQLASAFAEVRRNSPPLGTTPQDPTPTPVAPPTAPELPAAAMLAPTVRVEPAARRDAALVDAAQPRRNDAGQVAAGPAVAGQDAAGSDVAGSGAAGSDTAGLGIAGMGGASAKLDAAPAWLLASRRVVRPIEAAAAHDEPASDTTLAFESDDSELNAFAARMRGDAAPAEAMTISPQEAVARLEGLLRRLHAA